MDRKFETGRQVFTAAARERIPLFKDLKALRPDGADVVDEFVLSVGHAVARGAGSLESRVVRVSGWLGHYLREWANLRGDWENTIELRNKISKMTVSAMHSRAVENIQLCATHAKDGNIPAKKLVRAFKHASRVTAHLLEGAGQDKSA